MAFRGYKLWAFASPVRDGWVPTVFHGLRLIGCYETEATKEDAIKAAKFWALKWYREQRQFVRQATLF